VAFLRGQTFDALINCAALTSPDLCEVQPEATRLVHVEAPAAIAGLCRERAARLIQVSTDYVFGGHGREMLTEDAITEPVSVYGETKLAGERAVLAACPDALIARVSWLFGPDKGSFPDTILRQALAGGKVEAIQDKWSTPSSIDDLAQWLEVLLTTHRQVRGLLHLCNEGMASWQEYAQTTVDVAYKIGLLAAPLRVSGIPLEGFPPFKAARPRFTPLSCARFIGLTGIQPEAWQDALERYLRGKYSS
jgi:dTDP-4-dehydrorhamnose reductase